MVYTSSFKFQVSSFKNKGFTLLEVIAALFVLTVGVLAAYSVTSQLISATHLSANRLIAAYLAKEGIEIVRNIRDTNWIQDAQPDPAPPEAWDAGLAGGAGEWEADYTTVTFTGSGGYENCGVAAGHNCDSYDGDFLKINGGFYNYDSESDTNFKRKITITPVGINELDITVEVTWEEKGETKGPITVKENLYNWY